MTEKKPEKTPEEFLSEVLEPRKRTDHVCWKCKHFKWVIKDAWLPPHDIIGWCKKIHWPFFWCVAETPVIEECYAFEPRG